MTHEFSVSATTKARNIKCKDGFGLEMAHDVLRVSTDQWTLFTCSPTIQNAKDEWTPGLVDYGTRYTQLTKTDLSQTWIIQHNTFDYSSINRPDALMVPFRWTADGKYLYMYPRYYPEPSGFPVSLYFESYINDLYRINLETGKFELVLRREQFRALALSQDDRFLAYSEHDKPAVIHVRNMESGEDRQIDLKIDIVAAGPFAWNPEGTKIIFAVAYGQEKEETRDNVASASILVLTPENMHVRTIRVRDTRKLAPDLHGCEGKTWLDENTVCLVAADNFWGSYSNFIIDIRSGNVAPVSTSESEEITQTATPRP